MLEQAVHADGRRKEKREEKKKNNIKSPDGGVKNGVRRARTVILHTLRCSWITHHPINAVPFVQCGSNGACVVHGFDELHHKPIREQNQTKQNKKRVRPDTANGGRRGVRVPIRENNRTRYTGETNKWICDLFRIFHSNENEDSATKRVEQRTIIETGAPRVKQRPTGEKGVAGSNRGATGLNPVGGPPVYFKFFFRLQIYHLFIISSSFCC